MNPIVINDAFVDLSKIIRNDYKFSNLEIGKRICAVVAKIKFIEKYFEAYPPLVDISELGAALAYEGSSHQNELLQQIKYKLSELKPLLPDYK